MTAPSSEVATEEDSATAATTAATIAAATTTASTATEEDSATAIAAATTAATAATATTTIVTKDSTPAAVDNMVTEADIEMKATDASKTNGSFIMLDSGKAVDSSDWNDTLLIPPADVMYSDDIEDQSFMQWKQSLLQPDITTRVFQ